MVNHIAKNQGECSIRIRQELKYGVNHPITDLVLIRALEWIGESIKRESLDDKIVDICTALETWLVIKSDQIKGEAIAMRMMLLQTQLDKVFTFSENGTLKA